MNDLDHPPAKRGWFKAYRSEDALELVKANPLAYVLAAIIAMRARFRPGFNCFQLALGEAMLGDYKSYGMTEQEYRTAKAQLEKWGFATFRATNKGSVGKLTDTRLFSVLEMPDNGQEHTPTAGQQRSNNGRPTTNNNGENGNNEKKGCVSVWNLTQQIGAIDSQITEIRNRGTDDAVGWHPASEDDRKLFRELKKRRSALNAQLAGFTP